MEANVLGMDPAFWPLLAVGAVTLLTLWFVTYLLDR